MGIYAAGYLVYVRRVIWANSFFGAFLYGLSLVGAVLGTWWEQQVN